MRVLQLIDSLRPGGAEQMAISYANALVSRTKGSFLCCTRMEGVLKKKLLSEVGYLFLNKKNTLDPVAFLKLREFVKINRIDLIQAHSSSWFLAMLMKFSLPDVKIVWHDHYGRNLDERKPGLLKPASKYFDGIISVNVKLSEWSQRNLLCQEIRYFKNFLSSQFRVTHINDIYRLQGDKDSFKIICVANLRPQKDHVNLLNAFLQVHQKEENISLHLIGKDEDNRYSKLLKNFIAENNLKKNVFIYGEQEEVSPFLENADLGILSSASEGLPVALLEYGRVGLPVVCTEVGECGKVLGGSGKLVPPGDSRALAAAVEFYLENEGQRVTDANLFKLKVNDFLENVVIPDVLKFYNNLEE